MGKFGRVIFSVTLNGYTPRGSFFTDVALVDQFLAPATSPIASGSPRCWFAIDRIAGRTPRRPHGCGALAVARYDRPGPGVDRRRAWRE